MNKNRKYVVSLLVNATLETDAPGWTGCPIVQTKVEKWIEVMSTRSLCVAKDYLHGVQNKMHTAAANLSPVRLGHIMDISWDRFFEEALERGHPGMRVSRSPDMTVIGYKIMEHRAERVTRIKKISID